MAKCVVAQTNLVRNGVDEDTRTISVYFHDTPRAGGQYEVEDQGTLRGVPSGMMAVPCHTLGDALKELGKDIDYNTRNGYLFKREEVA
jgi:hypothetical protein